MEQLFLFQSFITLVGSIMVITSLNPIHSVFWLVLVFLNSSALLLLLEFSFMPLMLMMVYVGAIAMLFLFVMMMLDILHLSKVESINTMIPVVVIVFFNAMTYLYWYFSDFSLKTNFSNITSWDLSVNSQLSSMGGLLYTYYSYPFIIISLLLLMAMVGAIILVLDLGLITSSQTMIDQHQSSISKF